MTHSITCLVAKNAYENSIHRTLMMHLAVKYSLLLVYATRVEPTECISNKGSAYCGYILSHSHSAKANMAGLEL